MGFITTGKPLSADHPFFRSAGKDEPNAKAPVWEPSAAQEKDDESEDDDDNDYDFFDEEHRDDKGEELPIEQDYDEEVEDGNSFFAFDYLEEPKNEENT
jgi:hypothetical protein